MHDHSVSSPVDPHGVEGVYPMGNFTRVEIRDPGAVVTVRKYNQNGNALHIPWRTLTVELAGGEVHTVSDKGVGNGQVTFDGETVNGTYFVLDSAGHFEAIEAPTPGPLQMMLAPVEDESAPAGK